MPRRLSSISPDWRDYTTLDAEVIDAVARLTLRDLRQLSRPGFRVIVHDTLEDFHLAEALEYIEAWRRSAADNPIGICGPIGPTEQLPLVARIVRDLNRDVRAGHFWGMDEMPDSRLHFPKADTAAYRKSWTSGFTTSAKGSDPAR